MKLEVLMSCMYQENFDIAYRTKINSDLLIINQSDKDDYEEIKVDGYNWRMITTTERGLAKSRNMALKNSTGDICLVCDDDEELTEGYSDIILQAYNELPNAAAIVFNNKRINTDKDDKFYFITKKREAPRYRTYGSTMLSFNKNKISNISFNEHFGSGTGWGGGEDNLFFNDLRKNKLKIYEYPTVIATIDYSNKSQWFKGYNEQYYYNVGAFIEYANYNFVTKWFFRLHTCYKLRKRKELGNLNKIKWMLRGAKGIKNNIKYTEFVLKGRKK